MIWRPPIRGGDGVLTLWFAAVGTLAAPPTRDLDPFHACALT